MDDHKDVRLIYRMGVIDGMAHFILQVRNNELKLEDATLEIANILIAHDPQHPHALWVRDSLSKK